ncbi:MAG: hypothetical protein KCHDKBKB_02979 [Elusimicrobia bacterium]|nr:hypothetical protein [Elusimicrobiota bacterium]
MKYPTFFYSGVYGAFSAALEKAFELNGVPLIMPEFKHIESQFTPIVDSLLTEKNRAECTDSKFLIVKFLRNVLPQGLLSTTMARDSSMYITSAVNTIIICTYCADDMMERIGQSPELMMVLNSVTTMVEQKVKTTIN